MEKQPAMLCTLHSGALAERRLAIQELFKSRIAVTRHPDGFELQWTFSEETARSLLEFVLFERICCKTFTYELNFPPPHDLVTLRMRAPIEQVETLQAFYC
jgi:hypothetical protein